MEELKFLDLHYHIAPDLFERRHDILSLGPILKKLKGGVFAKSHLGSTVDVATLAQKLGYPIWGSLVLNKTAGPLHYKTVLHHLGRRDSSETMPLLVYLPTLKKHSHPPRLKRNLSNEYLAQLEPESEPLLLESGKVRNEIFDLFKFGNDHNIRFASGHTSKDELFPVIEVAEGVNISSFLLTHPMQGCVGLSEADLKELSKNKMIYFEQTALSYNLKYQTLDVFSHVLRNLPRVVYNSDFGQPNTPDVTEWFEESQAQFSDLKISKPLKQDLFVNNALEFLGMKGKFL